MRAIDTRHLGTDRVICCWEVDGVLVDPGPQSCEETLLAALDGAEPRALLLTHIHFDHAGAAGALVRRWPSTSRRGSDRSTCWPAGSPPASRSRTSGPSRTPRGSSAPCARRCSPR